MPTTTEQPHVSQVNRSALTRYVVAWTSNAAGAASESFDLIQPGELIGVTFKPGASGSQPTDAYDVTANDAYGVDTLAGQGANLSNATTTMVQPCIPAKDGTTTSTAPRPVDGTISVAVSNAGNTKSGTIVFWVR
jgi:hypothetical protein